ncbi:MAG: rod-binding protein [Bdellovibrionales bacterium]
MSKIDTKPQQAISLQQKAIDFRRKHMDPKEQLNKASKMYEKHFLNEMVKAMRSTVTKSDLLKQSMGDKIYSQKLDDEYVKSWVGRGGVGLSKLIYNQMMDQFGAQMGIQPKRIDPLKQPMLKIDKGRVEDPKIMNFNLKSDEKGASLDLPFSGRVLHQLSQDDGSKHLLLQHEKGIQSTWSGKGIDSFQAGTEIPAGKSLGKIDDSISLRIINTNS